jgi:hypothetical protein
VLRTGGQVILSTPNRVLFADGQGRPLNPWHVREFSLKELRGLLTARFDGINVFGQAAVAPGGVALTRVHLRLQSVLLAHRSPIARVLDWLYGWVLWMSMVPAGLAVAVVGENRVMPVVELEQLSGQRVAYYVAVAGSPEMGH